MKIGDLRKKTVNELGARLQEEREKLYQLRGEVAAGKLKNVKAIAASRKEIARTLTILGEAR